MNNKDLKNKAVALAVVATMTVPEAASVGAEVIQEVTPDVENIVETVAAEEGIEAEAEDAEAAIEAYTEYEEVVTPSDIFAAVEEEEEPTFEIKEDETAVVMTEAVTTTTAAPAFAFKLTENKTFTGKFDYFDDGSTTDLKRVETLAWDIPCDNVAQFDASKFKLCVDTKGTELAKDVAGVEPQKVDNNSVAYQCVKDSGSTKITLTLKVNKNFSLKTLYLSYDGKMATKNIQYTKNVGELPVLDTSAGIKGTKIDDKGILTYDGKATFLNIKSVYGKKQVKGVKITSTSVTTVILPSTVTSIDDAFGNAVATVVVPGKLTSVPTSIGGTNGLKIYYNGDASVFSSSDKSKVLPYGMTIDAGKEYDISLSGTTLALSLKEKKENAAEMIGNGDGKFASKLIAPVAYPENVAAGDVKWVVESIDGKTSSLAKVSTSAAKTATISDIKAAGQYNSNFVVKAVSAADPDVIYAMVPFFARPAKVTTITANDTLEVSVGGSAKISATVNADAANKALNYAVNNSNVTIINGTVKGVAPGTSTITITPQDGGSVSKTVTVTVNASASKAGLSVDQTSLALVKNETRTFTINNPTGKAVKFKYNDEKYVVKDTAANPATIAKETDTTIAGSKSFTINLISGKEYAKGDILTLECDGKNTIIKLSGETTYQNVTKLNEKNKKVVDDSGVKVVELDVVEGLSLNLGVSVMPAAADNTITWAVKKDKALGTAIDSGDTVEVKNGVFTTGSDPKSNTYYVQGTTAGVASDGTALKTNIYKINVYKTAGSLEWKSSNFVIQGGVLMTKEDSNAVCAKTIEGGQELKIAVPTNGKEDVIWTSSNPAAVSVNEVTAASVVSAADGKSDAISSGDKYLSLRLIQPGTYTVTGTTKYTKQKISFKVTVGETVCTKVEFVDNSADITLSDGSAAPATLEQGKSASLIMSSTKCGTVKFTSSDSKSVSVDAKGNIKVNAKADTTKAVTITATMTQKVAKGAEAGKIEKTYSVTPSAATTGSAAVTVKTTVKTSVQDGADLAPKAVFKNVDKSATVKWYYKAITIANGTKSYGSETELVANSDKKYVLPALSGSETTKYYKVYPSYTVSGTETKMESECTEVGVYQYLAAKASVHPEDAAKIKRLGTAGKGIASGNTGLIPAGTDAAGSIVIDFEATGIKETTDPSTNKKKKEIVPATVDDIEWTSSNSCLVPVGNIVVLDHTTEASGNHPNCDKEDAYGKCVKITANNKGYTGTVVLTGTFKNSGKKVSLKINVK